MMDATLLQEFSAETGEHLEEMETSLLSLENDPGNRDLLDTVFRSAHTIKGAAEYFGLEKIAELSHKLENLLDILRAKERVLDREIVDALIVAKDRLAMLNDDLERRQVEETAIGDIVERIDRIANAAESGRKAAPASETAKPAPEPAAAGLDAGGASPTPGAERDIEEFDIDDMSEDSYDDELLEIFLDHTRENLEALKAEIAGLADADDPAAVLSQLPNMFEGLHSSANYMEYFKLLAFYDKWRIEAEAARKSLADDRPVDMGRVTERMHAFAAKLEHRLNAAAAAAAPPESPAADEEALLGPALDEPVIDDDVTAALDEDLGEDLSLDPDALEPDSGDPASETAAETAASLDMALEPDAEMGLSEDREATEAEPDAASPPAAEAEVASLEFEMTEDAAPAETGEPAAVPEGAEAAAPEESLDAYQGLYDELEDAFDLREEADDDSPESYQGLYSELDDAFGEALEPEPAVEAQAAAEAGAESIDEPAEARSAVAEPTAESPAAAAAPAPGPEPEAARKPGPEPPEQRAGEKTIKHTLRVDASKIDSLMNQVGELVVSRAWFSQLYREMRDLQHQFQESGRFDQKEMKPVRALTFKLSEATVALGRVANELQEGVMKVRMLPIAQLFNRYPRLVRDLVRDADKKVRLDIVGEETELDKMIIEEISDPLIHIIRNAVDHGCETAAERRAAGKPEHCVLKLESYHESNHVVIEISDDGRGIHLDKIRKAAMEKGLFQRDDLERMTERDLLSVIMAPGFSTAQSVTKTSGRGVGMDVVKQNVEKLNGAIEIDSKPGVGTRFRIKIPLTLAIIRALLVRVGKAIFTIPLAAVEETMRIFDRDVYLIEGVEVIHYRDSTLSLLRLSELFGITPNLNQDGKSFVVVVNTGMKSVGLVVDELIGQEEAVIKPLVDYLQESSGFSGATILGDGRISMILDIYELVNLSIGNHIRMKNEAEERFDGFGRRGAFDARESAALH